MEHFPLIEGKVYRVRVRQHWVLAQYVGSVKLKGYVSSCGNRISNSVTRYEFRNLSSGRNISIKSYQKIREQ